MRRLSVVIANYNYARFVGTAIESALKVDWPDVEIVVVDDGSTDDSVEVIERYGDRVRLLRIANSGQREACNRGFALTAGDVVIFLDADDVLPANAAHGMAHLWSPSVSKVQFRMQRIDVHGHPVGTPFPTYEPVPSATDIRRWARQTSAYPTPPGSGNAYARWFLESVMPVGPEVGTFLDSALLASAPLLGDVVCAPEVEVLYRRHDDNDSNLLVDDDRFAREVARAASRWRFARRAAGDADLDDRPLRRSRELLQLRVAASRLSADQWPLSGDGRRRLLADIVRSVWQPGPETVAHRLTVAAWSLVTVMVPLRVARTLVVLRYRTDGRRPGVADIVRGLAGQRR